MGWRRGVEDGITAGCCILSISSRSYYGERMPNRIDTSSNAAECEQEENGTTRFDV